MEAQDVLDAAFDEDLNLRDEFKQLVAQLSRQQAEVTELRAEVASSKAEIVQLKKAARSRPVDPDRKAPDGWFPVIPWLEDRGITFKTLGEKSKVGTEVKDIAERMGKTPEMYRYRGKGRSRNHYPLRALEKWLAIHLRTNPVHRFPSLFGVVDDEPATRRTKKRG